METPEIWMKTPSPKDVDESCEKKRWTVHFKWSKNDAIADAVCCGCVNSKQRLNNTANEGDRHWKQGSGKTLMAHLGKCEASEERNIVGEQVADVGVTTRINATSVRRARITEVVSRTFHCRLSLSTTMANCGDRQGTIPALYRRISLWYHKKEGAVDDGAWGAENK